MKKRRSPKPVYATVLGLVRDLLLGGRHSRTTVASQTGRSLGTADRWLEAIEEHIPGARRVKVGKTAWIEIPQPEPWKPKKRLAKKP